LNALVPPDQITDWIPGRRTVDSTSRGWQGLEFIGYKYASQDVEIPEMRDYMIVVYRGQAARMGRSDGGKWQEETVEAGVVSLLSRAEKSRWAWNAPIDVQHIYLSHESISGVACEIYDRPLEDIEIHDHVRREDNVFPRIAEALTSELTTNSAGANLLAGTLRTQSCIHLLRNYANIRFREVPSSGGFGATERRLLDEYIRNHLSRKIALDDMAAVVGLSSFHFLRKFKESYGQTPHHHVTAERICRAKSLLNSSNMPIAWISDETGFSDQSHFTRVFRETVGVTPAKFRRG